MWWLGTKALDYLNVLTAEFLGYVLLAFRSAYSFLLDRQVRGYDCHFLCSSFKLMNYDSAYF